MVDQWTNIKKYERGTWEVRFYAPADVLPPDQHPCLIIPSGLPYPLVTLFTLL